MKFTTLIPLFRNDGSRVSKREMNAILKELRSRFGALTQEGPVIGHWVDTTDGRVYVDESLKSGSHATTVDWKRPAKL